MTTFSPEEILHDIGEMKSQLEALIDKSNQDKTRVLLLGTTGAGKTTLMHLISDCEMIAEKVPKNPHLVLQCQGNCRASNMNMGHNRTSQTKLPVFLEIGSNVLLFDCPGLIDNRSIEQRILNSFAINRLLVNPCKIKLLIVIAAAQFDADKAKSAMDVFDKVSCFFSDYDLVEQCAGLVITKMEPYSEISEILDYTDSDSLNTNPLVTFFKEHPERCFRVNKPSQKGKYESFTEKKRLLDFMQSDTALSVNPTPDIILDTETVQALSIACEQRNERMNARLHRFARELSESYRCVNDIDTINQWISRLYDFRNAAHQGLEQFAQTLRQYNEYQNMQNLLDNFILWRLFFNEVVLAASQSPEKQMFQSNILVHDFDELIEELRNRRDRLETQAQSNRDTRINTITKKITEIIDQCGVVPDVEMLFFDNLEYHPVHFCSTVHNFHAIQFDLINCDNNVLKGNMPKEMVKQVEEQMTLILQDTINYFRLTQNSSITNEILERIRTTDQDPDEFVEFKNYVSNSSNKFLSYVEIYAHPIDLLLSVPVISCVGLRKVVTKQRDITNIDKFMHWVYDNTLVQKQNVYCFLKQMFVRYREISRVSIQNCPISFKYRDEGYYQFPIFDVHPLLPNDTLTFLISQCKLMSEILEKAYNQNSLDVFNAIEAIYLRVNGEITQKTINQNGYEQYQAVARGERIDTTLDALIQAITNAQNNKDDQIILYSQIIATTRMLGAIHGRGQKAHERSDLFGLRTTVNCQNQDGSVRIYSRQNAIDIKNTILLRVRDLICQLENTTEQTIGDFSETHFCETSRNYVGRVEREYQESQTELSSSIQDLLAKINSTFIRPKSGNGQTSTGENSSNCSIPRQSSSNRSLTRQNSASHGISRQNSSNNSASTENNKNENLLQELEKVDGVQVLDRQDDNLDVTIRGSVFRITVSKLIDLAPEINRSVNSTMKFVQSQTKKEKISKFSQLINFFDLAKTALANKNTQGIMVQINLSGKELVSIEPIILNHDQL